MSTTPEMHGPIDYVLIEFPSDRLDGSAGAALVDLVESGVIRLLDLLVVSKSEDGTVEAIEVTDPAGPGASFSYFAGARSGLLGDEDIQEAGGVMTSGTVAALIVYENSWAIPFVGAVQHSGGELIASARIPATEVMAALETLEAED